MQKIIIGSVIAGALVVAAAGCGNSSAPAFNRAAVYQQMERLSRPAVKEATEAFNNHDITNRSNPYNKSTDAQLDAEIVSFVGPGGVANRSTQITQTIESILIPDEMTADLSKTGVLAAYLGVETGGATGSLFGGRKLPDDVIAIDLGAIFGNTIPAVVPSVPDDGHESWCLTNDNVAYPGGNGTTFPYLDVPR